MPFYCFISKNSIRLDQNIITKYFNFSLENNFVIEKIFSEDHEYSDDLIEKCTLKNLLKKKEFRNSTLIVNNCLDLAENLKDLSKIYIHLKELNVKVEIIESNDSSLLMDGLNKLGISKPKSKKFSKISESIHLKSNRGSVLSRIPIGYEKSINGKFMINKKDKVIVRKIFNLYSGNFGNEKRKGLRKISQIIKNEFKTSYKWSPQSVKSILKNRFYLGVYQRDSKIIFNNHEQIVTNDEFNFIQEIFKNNQNEYSSNLIMHVKKRYHNLICSYCNSKLKISYHSRKWRLSNGILKERVYNYVDCNQNCKFQRGRINMPGYEDKEFSSDGFLFADYKKRLMGLRGVIKLLIRGKLSLDYFKREIEIIDNLENLLKLNNKQIFNFEDLNITYNRKIYLKL